MSVELLDKIISLTENNAKLRIENEQLKKKLKYERELNKFRAMLSKAIRKHLNGNSYGLRKET